MGEFFKVWKRKIGCLTLVMACVLMGGWVRSLGNHDGVIVVRHKESSDAFLSFRHSLFWQTTHVDRMDFIAKVNGKTFTWISTPVNDPKEELKHLPPLKWAYFGIEKHELESPGFRMTILVVPYWSITIPLTLISACLLLSKPKPSNQNKSPSRHQSREIESWVSSSGRGDEESDS